MTSTVSEIHPSTRPGPVVTVYTRPNCQPCAATKRELAKRGVEYQEVDATDNLEALMSLGYREAPVVLVRPAGKGPQDEDGWSGFRPDKLAEHFPKQ